MLSIIGKDIWKTSKEIIGKPTPRKRLFKIKIIENRVLLLTYFFFEFQVGLALGSLSVINGVLYTVDTILALVDYYRENS